MVVIGCEGPCEVALVNRLLDDDLLKFDKKDILDRRPIHFRQPISIAPLINILPPEEPIIFYRVGDTQTDEYDLSCLSSREHFITVHKVCTKPEIEILIIINENLYKEFLKQKSKKHPKEFVEENVKNYSGFADYAKKHDLSIAVKQYKSLKRHRKGEEYLADLLK